MKGDTNGLMIHNSESRLDVQESEERESHALVGWLSVKGKLCGTQRV